MQTQVRIKRVLETMDKAQVDKINEMNKDEAVFAKLTRSIALTVHGHAEIKRGLLLMLFGGVQKRTPEGIRCVSGVGAAQRTMSCGSLSS